MLRWIESRAVLACTASAAVGTFALSRWPFPNENALLQLVLLRAPWVFFGIKYSYLVMLFSTPWIALSVVLSSAYIFAMRTGKNRGLPKLPPYP